MAYETTNDVELKSFNHDKQRGKWASSKDFLFACIGHAFRADVIFLLPSSIFRHTGIYGLIAYAIVMMVCTAPIMFLQAFLGQFSSTGFISAFRIAPIFKGLGYASLAINLMILTYYSTFAAIPLFYFFNSLRPTLPWSCDNDVNWEPRNSTTICHIIRKKIEVTHYTYLRLPSQQFLMNQTDKPVTFTFSWSLFACSVIIWVCAWMVLRKPVEMVGRIIRYMTMAMLVTLSICFLRFAFLPGALRLEDFIKPWKFKLKELGTFVLIPFVALSGLGAGWGSVLSMASYNDFKTDIRKYTWVLCLAHGGLMVATGLSWVFVENFLIDSNPEQINIIRDYDQWIQVLSIPTALSFLELPHFWSLLFFGMLTLGATNLLIVQLFSVLTALFDEYEQLRNSRSAVTFVTVVVLCLISLFFCCDGGIPTFEILSQFSALTQVLLNFTLILVVLCIYGRERFQRDVYCMISLTPPTWLINIARIMAPPILLISFLTGFLLAIYSYGSACDLCMAIALILVGAVFVISPCLIVPGYCIYKLVEATGLLKSRFKKCCHPTDWYPADPDNRRRYDEMLSRAEVNHQLTTL